MKYDKDTKKLTYEMTFPGLTVEGGNNNNKIYIVDNNKASSNNKPNLYHEAMAESKNNGNDLKKDSKDINLDKDR